jgi:hypothetical protein
MRRTIAFVVLMGCSVFLYAAEDANRYVDFSAGYSQGDFDTGETSSLTRLQVGYGQVWEDYDFSVLVPYLYLDDEFGNESGLGDITLRAGMRLGNMKSPSDNLYASVAIKLPTADEDKGLGSGEADVGGFLSYHHALDDLSLSLLGGYIITGDSSAQSYNDIFVYGAGISKISFPWYVYGSLDGRQQTLEGADDPLELSAGFYYQLKERQFLKLEGFVGLNNASPDGGLSVGVVNWF